MARVSGVKEKVHSPMYDAFFVPGAKNGTVAKTFTEMMIDPRVIRFFVDVQNKTKLETNLQAAGVLPSQNTFEARAMRVVASSFCLPKEALTTIREPILTAADTYRNAAPFAITTGNPPPATEPAAQDQLVNAIQGAFATRIGVPSIRDIRPDILTAADAYRNAAPFATAGNPPPAATPADKATLFDSIVKAFDAGCAAASAVLSELIYNSVTTLLVGEKVMIEMPTFWFPAGAGVSPGNGTAMNHGEPDPMATFRFAEPVTIEPQQNFRVEMLFPQGLPGTLTNVLGPLRVWVVLDGYLTRDVQ